MSLSDPDGQELVLEGLSVKAAVHGVLSLTEMEFRFRNPTSKRMEGRFQMVLPAGAAISRFAKEVNGKLMEGEVVERLRANRIYDEILHEMRDPALLEQEQGNRFSARIFPIEPRAAVRLVLSYSLLVPDESGIRTYRFPLRGLPKVGHFRFTAILKPLEGESLSEKRETGLKVSKNARVSAVETVELEERDFVPETDIEFSWKAEPTRARSQILRSGDFALYAFRPALPKPASQTGPRNWHFFVDTSASGAEGARFRGKALEKVFRTLPASDRVEITFFDQTVVHAGEKSAGEWARSIDGALRDRGFLGATDLGAALSAVSASANRAPATIHVIASDGAATLGAAKPAELAKSLEMWPSATMLHALVLGPRQDRATLDNLTRGRGRVAEVRFTENMDERAEAAARQLQLPMGSEFEMSDPSAEWIYPRTVTDIQAGQEILCFARIRSGEAPRPGMRKGATSVSNGPPRVTNLHSDFAPLLEREAYRAYLSHLSAKMAKEKDPASLRALESEQVRISLEYRILIPQTTLLVLETEADYRRFGLERKALSSILTVGMQGLEKLDRDKPVFVTSAPRPRENQVTNAPASDDKDQLARRDGNEAATGAKEKGRVGAGMADTASQREASSSAKKTERDRSQAAPSLNGGVEGGVMGGVLGSAPEAEDAVRQSSPEAMPLEVAQAPSVAAAPPPRPARATAQEPARRPMPAPTGPGQTTGGEDSRSVPPPTWTTAAVATAETVRSLEEQIRSNPLAREPYSQLAEALAGRKEWKKLRELSRSWLEYDPENPQGYETLGEALLALDRKDEAARAFGSLVEVAAAKPELVQRSGLLLFRAGFQKMAEKVLRSALEMRPDRLNAHRHLALVLWRAGKFDEAARVLESALKMEFPGWSAGSRRQVFSEELGYVLRSWRMKVPAKRAEIEARARQAGVDLDRMDRVRITLAWETDANDVDLHVADPGGAECYYGRKSVPSGLHLYEDVTRGFGPEVIRGATPKPGTYTIGVKYFSSGPMGASRGLVFILTANDTNSEPDLQIIPFRLVSGGGSIRRITSVEIKGKNPLQTTR
jgi:hypothetical protein